MEAALSVLGPDGRPITASLENPSVSLSDPDAWFETIEPGHSTVSGVRVTTDRALGYPPYWRALNLISGDVGRLPLNTYRKESNGGKEVAAEHPSYNLLRRRASPIMRASSFKRTLTWHAMHYGNGLAAIFRDQMGNPMELLVLNPESSAMAIVDDEPFIITTIENQYATIPYRDVFHVKGLSHNGVWGMRVIDIMRQALGLPIAAREYTSRFFGSGSNQSGVLMVPQSFSPEKIQNTIKAWNEMASGLAKSHKVALLQDNVKFIPTSISPHDSETTGILEHEVRSVSAITGAPPHKLGDVTRTSYNSLEQEEQAYLQDGLDPWLHEWEEEADTKLLSEDEQRRGVLFHEFNRNARMRMDSTARGQFYKVLRETGAFSANDILRRENLPTLGREGDVRYVPSNWMQLGSVNNQAVAAHRRLVEGIVLKKQEIACQKLLKSSEKAELQQFVDGLDEFCDDLCVVLIESLDDACEVIEGHCKRQVRTKWREAIIAFADDVKHSLASFVEARKAAILAENGSRQLKMRIESTVSRQRFDDLVNRLMETTHAP